mmetsp:Transcript_21374/g.50234  ORF Transcript_21374/g.50234 Transcript_21374/m.50234 type:complete len:208 (-) Transcript_21374:236-859(-)|eukprot:CAMPEP_0114541822 /NCGR_PEP_ID=MMETSP0114-20121206/1509_1 /TAXON_ID=31324 /ORGANISM="Goniomonas sp, Strain m" /LENGTH=207 /DNA_ID=CAMNT_0001726083 /DNA_START=66 /DNA_END=689 /DNA_ORIENTATION=+
MAVSPQLSPGPGSRRSSIQSEFDSASPSGQSTLCAEWSEGPPVPTAKTVWTYKGHEEEIISQGWLTRYPTTPKLRVLARSESNVVLGWHRRWFVLTPTRLRYFKDENYESQAPRGDLLLGTVECVNICLDADFKVSARAKRAADKFGVQSSEGDGIIRFAFEIRAGETLWKLRSGSLHDRSQWVEAIRTAAKSAPRIAQWDDHAGGY